MNSTFPITSTSNVISTLLKGEDTEVAEVATTKRRRVET